MPRYVAFLRAINVGGSHVVKMDTLRARFEGLGFSRVETFIASGNVIFETRSKDAAGLERRIEAMLEMSLETKTAAIPKSMRSSTALRTVSAISRGASSAATDSTPSGATT